MSDKLRRRHGSQEAREHVDRTLQEMWRSPVFGSKEHGAYELHHSQPSACSSHLTTACIPELYTVLRRNFS
jgi:hypothetical protein